MPVSTFGAFSEPGYLAVSDPYDKPKQKRPDLGAFRVSPLPPRPRPCAPPHPAPSASRGCLASLLAGEPLSVQAGPVGLTDVVMGARSLVGSQRKRSMRDSCRCS